jgi:hypothetical protein
VLVAMGEASRYQRSLAISELGKRRILAALEAALGHERGLAVSDEDESGHEVGRQR